MLMGEHLLRDLGIELDQLDHRRFSAAKALIDERGELYFEEASRCLEVALKELYGGQGISLQRLSATFRRGDLLAILGRAPS